MPKNLIKKINDNDIQNLGKQVSKDLSEPSQSIELCAMTIAAVIEKQGEVIDAINAQQQKK